MIIVMLLCTFFETYTLQNSVLTQVPEITQTLKYQLLAAATDGDLNRVKEAHSKGAPLNACNDKKRNALHKAAISNHLSVATYLLSERIDAQKKDRKGFTPLHVAACHGHADFVNLLLTHGVDINAQTRKGLTALHLAAQGGHIEVVRQLLHHSADTTLTSQNSSTALKKAQTAGHKDICELLKAPYRAKRSYTKDGRDLPPDENTPPTPSPKTRLFNAAKAGKSGDIDDLLKTTPVDIPGRYSTTALHWACEGGHEDCVRILLDAGANINAVDSVGFTPFILACSFGHLNVANLLYLKGADTKAVDKDKMNALHWAALKGHEAVVVFLLSLGIPANEKDAENMTPPQYAESKNFIQIARLIRESNSK